MITDIYVDLSVIKQALLYAIDNNKELLDSDSSSVESKLYALYETEVKLDDTQFWKNKHVISEYFSKKCKNLASYFDDGTTLDRFDLYTKEKDGKLFRSGLLYPMVRQLRFELALQKADVSLAIKVLNCLHDYLGNAYYFEVDREVLQELFENAFYLFLSADNYRYFKDAETTEIIRAMKRLLNKYELEYVIEHGEIIISDNSDIIIHNVLERLISTFGGVDFLRVLMNEHICPKYNVKLDRYLIHRDKRHWDIDAFESRIPYNYLVQLGAKHLDDKRAVVVTQAGAKKIIDEIIQIGKDYLSVLNLQSYSIFEDMFVDYSDIPVQLSKNIVFEKMYTPIQYSPNFTLSFLEKVYKPLAQDSNAMGYKFCEYMRFCKTLLSDKRIGTIYDFNELERKTGINRVVLKKILSDVSIASNEVNQVFTDFKCKTDYKYKPLIRLKDNTFFWFSPHFNGFSLCETAYCKLKALYPGNFNRLKGKLVEDWVKSFFTDKGYTIHCGKYNPDSKSSTTEECDMVIENNEKIVFFEIKNNPLPEEFELGGDVETLSNLADGMFKAQLQCAKHHYHLINNGKLTLMGDSDSSTPKYELVWNKRRIIRVSVCSQEYYFLTNKVFTEKLLQSLLVTTYHATDKSKENRLNKLNRYQSEFEKVLFKSADGKIDLKESFFNTLFRSAQQIYSLLKVSCSLDDFIERLTQSVYIADGSGDAYCQLLNS